MIPRRTCIILVARKRHQVIITLCHEEINKQVINGCPTTAIKFAHMSNTLDQIPVDKTWSPTESSRKMKPEVQ